MKKLSFILALVLVLTCGVLAACNEESVESSAPAEESGEATVESSASTEESTEESTEVSAEASEEASEEETKDESKPSTTAGANVAKDKTYVISGSGKPGGQYTANLTDGVAGDDVHKYDDTWFAFYANQTADPSLLNVDAESKGYIIIDLGEKKDLSKIRVHCGNNMDSGVPSPAWMDCKVSDTDDLGSFTYVCEVPRMDSQKTEYANGAFWTEADLSGFSGRYVMLNVTVNGTWCWINEIEVYEAE